VCCNCADWIDLCFPYEPGEAPRRIQMIADGRFEELRAEMREELARRER
jgi:hypothetical protein